MPLIRTLTPFVVRAQSSIGGADSLATHWSLAIETPSSVIVRTRIVAPVPVPPVVAYTVSAVYPPPALIISTEVTAPAPAPDGEGEELGDEDTEDEGDEDTEEDAESDGDDETDTDGDAEMDEDIELERRQRYRRRSGYGRRNRKRR